jgi:hypothetical protein
MEEAIEMEHVFTSRKDYRCYTCHWGKKSVVVGGWYFCTSPEICFQNDQYKIEEG